MPPSDDAAQRRQIRSRWPGRLYRLGEEPHDDLGDHTTPGERVAMMWPLALDAWAAAGIELPTYAREAMPGKLWGPGERPADE